MGAHGRDIMYHVYAVLLKMFLWSKTAIER